VKVLCVFLPREQLSSAVLADVILSVYVSHACFLTKPNSALWIFWYYTKGQSL